MAVDPLLQGLITGFATESQELCEKVTREMLLLERAEEGSEALTKSYDTAARGLHTLKGSAATLGLEDLSDLAHRMENVLAPLRAARRPVPAKVADALLRSLDLFLVQVKAHATGRSDALVDLSAALALLDECMKGDAGDAAAPAKPAAAPPAAKAAEGEAAEEAPAEGEAESSWRVSTRQVLSLMREVERLRELYLRLGDRRREFERTLAQMSKVALTTEAAEMRAVLMSAAQLLGTDSEEASDIVTSMEDGLKAICTLPVRTILDPLQRAVRDLCRTLGKEARLSVVGGEVSLDRRVLQSLRRSLVHLVRNALDHGIEPPEERERRGKHREGALVIRVEQAGNMLFVEVADDGNGIDVERIRKVALERNVASTAELAAMTPAQLQQLIFRPGFSTSAQVTETSGRGVGMDEVRAQMQAIHGQVEAQSVLGQGTRIILSLPAELGSSPILVARCGEHQMGIPMLSIETILAAEQSELRSSRTKVQLQYREQLVTVQDLGAILGLRQAQAVVPGQPLLVIQSQGKKLALAVDEVVGDWDLVIRPLPNEVQTIPAYQGAATLARGELMLVLRPDWLVDQERPTAATRVSAARRALVVDDSLTARALHRSMLEAAGFTVYGASSAKQALEQLQHAMYDVAICDVNMDDMDGIALTSAIRSRAETRDLPVILVSMLDSPVDRQRGLDAGADAFLSKKDCASGRLLAEVSGVLARRRPS